MPYSHFTIETLAAYLHLNPPQVSRLTRQATSASLAEMHEEQRIEAEIRRNAGAGEPLDGKALRRVARRAVKFKAQNRRYLSFCLWREWNCQKDTTRVLSPPSSSA